MWFKALATSEPMKPAKPADNDGYRRTSQVAAQADQRTNRQRNYQRPPIAIGQHSLSARQFIAKTFHRMHEGFNVGLADQANAILDARQADAAPVVAGRRTPELTGRAGFFSHRHHAASTIFLSSSGDHCTARHGFL
jgi:hypothetical protein